MPAYVNKQYSKFQLIGYEIWTVPVSKSLQKDPDSKFIGPPGGKSPEKYLKFSSNKDVSNQDAIRDKDAYTRLMRLARVVDVAVNHNHVEKDGGTLKIFMAPEFLFRPGKNTTVPRSYSAETATDIIIAFTNMFEHECFKDWLFVPGSVIFNRKTVSTKLPSLEKDVVLNTATMVKGGHSIDPPFQSIVKTNYADVDDIDPKYFSKDTTLGDILGTFESQKDAILEVDGLRFGLEICLDHDNNVLWNLMFKKGPKNVGLNWKSHLDFHMLTAGGMEISKYNVAAAKNGYVLRSDGQHSELYEPYTDMQFVKSQVGLDFKNNGNTQIVSLSNKTKSGRVKPDYPTSMVDDLLVKYDGFNEDKRFQGLRFYQSQPIYYPEQVKKI